MPLESRTQRYRRLMSEAASRLTAEQLDRKMHARPAWALPLAQIPFLLAEVDSRQFADDLWYDMEGLDR